MAIYERGKVRIHYEEKGSGFPLLIIPGGTFSRRDTHFRISYAAADTTLERGIEILRRIARFQK